MPVFCLTENLSTQHNTSNNQDGRVWDVIIATCDEAGAGTDASAYLKIYYEAGHDYETFSLDNPGSN
uniref:PLAT domain-containing protein n=1 Tax=Heterorhabditis bacteriophora TaxID=37862 RepID=A0A1I7XFA7_HETBA